MVPAKCRLAGQIVRDETLLTAQRGGFGQRRSALYKPEGTGLSHQFEFAITI